ncbi:NADH-quinone oxidoreductase subunit C [Kyrpidia tusciae]|uniref:NADH-quinone oxidoreductase n=1 Tax=Kyrpidia tusciae (strain DSM 2912 / NBRC 15312 / T2) TaxID=562970 RepID=D5WX56_KYRT2|nr:NADH-quinone oxidoreductase subunit C [Kyrpidia tusciae]ADG07837.1 NADH dehydrogenase (ubiquinone) 30 kDa subunit [Kyrpidia tusciae DSM 2912]
MTEDRREERDSGRRHSQPKDASPGERGQAEGTEAGPSDIQGEGRVPPSRGGEKDAASSEASSETVDAPRAVPPKGGHPGAKPAGADGGSAKPEAARPATKAAGKPSAAPKPPDPREAPAKALLDDVLRRIQERYPDAVEAGEVKKFTPMLLIKRESWREVAAYLKEGDGLGFRYLEAIAGTDYPKEGYIEVTAFLTRIPEATMVGIKVRAPREAPVVPSLVPVFPGANWDEREIYDLLGVTFADHPDLRRIMMPDDWQGHPLRKDYSPFD